LPSESLLLLPALHELESLRGSRNHHRRRAVLVRHSASHPVGSKLAASPHCDRRLAVCAQRSADRRSCPAGATGASRDSAARLISLLRPIAGEFLFGGESWLTECIIGAARSQGR